jgi:flagellar hook assembly protein FlgD
MTSPIPLVANDTSSSSPTSTPSSTSGTSTASNTLGPDSFITLLTAQLQAQDPLSPMDPDQMVTELTSINTLEQITQIRTDMDTLVGVTPPAQSGTSSNAIAGSNAVMNASSSANASAPFAAKLYSELNATSQLNSNSQSY